MAWWRKPQDYYKNMIIGCTPGVHEEAVARILRHTSARSGVLDCGCRSGALLSRLRDAGFDDLHGLDLDTEIFVPTDIPVTLQDLNQDFDRNIDRKFNLITCSDVMEHLNSPRDFMRRARNLLEDDGHLLITVPNIAFWVGRVKFALTGEHWGYGEKFYRCARHVSPTTLEETTCMLREVGYDVVSWSTAGSFFGPLKAVATAPAAAAFRLLGGPTTRGECLVVLARKAAPDMSLAQPTLYHEAWRRSAVNAAEQQSAA